MSAPVTFVKKPPQAIGNLRRRGGSGYGKDMDRTPAAKYPRIIFRSIFLVL